jgi:TonB family protein
VNKFALSIAAAILSTASAYAQTSSVSLARATAVGNTPLAIDDAEYPLSSLTGNEQGDVNLTFTVDPAGHPANLRIESSTASQLLELQSEQLAMSKWIFQPVQPDTTVELTFSWKLPLQTADNYYIDLPTSAGTGPLVPVASHAVRVADYPIEAIRAGEMGIVGLRYTVSADGTIKSVETVVSSGIKLLDDAAVKMIRSRWRFEPIPSERVNSATVDFNIVPPRRPFRCYAAPIIGEENVHVTATIVGFRFAGPPIDRWVFVNGSGEISDVLLRTKMGLMRASESLRPTLAGKGYAAPGGQGCWYYAPIYLSN